MFALHQQSVCERIKVINEENETKMYIRKGESNVRKENEHKKAFSTHI